MRDKDCCFPKHPKHPKHPKDDKHCKPKEVILECGTNPQPAIFDTSQGNFGSATEGIQTANYPGFQPGFGAQKFTLDRVRVDTRCQCKPQVKIEFSSLVYHRDAINQVEGTAQRSFELLFELIRDCDGEKEVIQSWTYQKTINFQTLIASQQPIEFSEPFTVTFCDQPCPGCCEYIMKVTLVDINTQFIGAGTVNLNNFQLMVLKPDISAIAQDKCKCCDCC